MNQINKLFILLIVIVWFLSINVTNGQEEYYGNYYYSDKDYCYNEMMLQIRENSFSLFIDSLIIFNIGDSNSDIAIVYPNYTGVFMKINDSIALLSDTTNIMSFLIDITDTLNLKLLRSTKQENMRINFVRSNGLYLESSFTQYNKSTYSKKWSYGKSEVFANGPFIIDDNYFYYYDKNGVLLKKVKDSCKIHPYSHFFE